jgi:hypothetical protein
MNNTNAIKYQRLEFSGNTKELQQFFDGLVTNGFQILYYCESKKKNEKFNDIINVVVVCYKINNLNNL